MDILWTILAPILMCLIPLCCILIVCCIYCTATCGCNPAKMVLIMAMIHMALVPNLVSAQISLTSESYTPCNYNEVQSTVLNCNQEGVFTRFNLNATVSLANTTVITYDIPWTTVAADITGKKRILQSAYSCAGHTDCRLITNNTNIRIRVIPTQITYNLRRHPPFVPYTYFFGTFNASYNASLADPTLLTTGPGTCMGAPANLARSECILSSPLEADVQPSILSGQLCGTNYDSIATTAYVRRVVNSQDYCQGAVCGDCVASNITAPTMAASFPALPYCSVFKIIPSPYLTAALEIIISNDNVTDTYSIFLRTNAGKSLSISNRFRFVRGALNRVTLNGPTVPYDVGPSRPGYVVMCGSDKKEATFQQLILGAKNPLLNVTGGVPTANGLNNTVSWYYVSVDKFATDYGLDCDQNGNAGGMGNNLYNSENALNIACPSTQASDSPLNGKCVPGTQYSKVKTPCQVASSLNDYSADFIASTNNGSTPPLLPPNLPYDWNPNYPNYHIFKIGKSFYLSRYPTGRANYPTINMETSFDVSEEFVKYGKKIPNAIVSISQSSCFYNNLTQVGMLNIMLCNIGSSSGDFIVTIQSVGQPIGFNQTVIVFDKTLPDSQSITGLSNIEGHRCVFLPAPYMFSLDTNTGFLQNHTLPIFIGNVTYTITDGTGTVNMGLVHNPVISCDAYSGNGTLAVSVDYNTTTYSCPSLVDALAWQDGCVSISVLLYVCFGTIFVMFIVAVVVVICCATKTKKSSQINSSSNKQLYLQNPSLYAQKTYGRLVQRKTSVYQDT